MVEDCKRSLYHTAVILCQWERMVGSRIHQAALAWLQKQLDKPNQDILLMWPRDFLKTSTLAAFVIYTWIKNPEIRLLLVHSSGEEASKLVPMLERIVESSDFVHFFPELVPEDKKAIKWNESVMTVARKGNYREASLEARGINSTIVGSHYDIILFDDVVDKDIVWSPVEVQRAIDFYEHSPNLFDRKEYERLIIAGTWWEGGFYERVLQEESFASLIFGAEIDERLRKFMDSMGYEVVGKDGEPAWPEYYDVERLAKRKMREGPVKYARQMLNIPATAEEVRFNRSDFRYYNWNDTNDSVIVEGETLPFRSLDIRMMCDPATGENLKTCESALNVSGFHRRTGRIIVLEEWGGRVLPGDLISRILSMAKKWRQHGLQYVGIEEVGFQATLKHFLRQEMQRQGIWFSVRPIPVGNRSKAERIIDGLQPFVANHQVYFLANQSGLLKQLAELRIARGRIIGNSPDRVDALAMHTPGWKMDVERSEASYAAPSVVRPAYDAACLT